MGSQYPNKQPLNFPQGHIPPNMNPNLAHMMQHNMQQGVAQNMQTGLQQVMPQGMQTGMQQPMQQNMPAIMPPGTGGSVPMPSYPNLQSGMMPPGMQQRQGANGQMAPPGLIIGTQPQMYMQQQQQQRMMQGFPQPPPQPERQQPARQQNPNHIEPEILVYGNDKSVFANAGVQLSKLEAIVMGYLKRENGITISPSALPIIPRVLTTLYTRIIDRAIQEKKHRNFTTRQPAQQYTSIPLSRFALLDAENILIARPNLRPALVLPQVDPSLALLRQELLLAVAEKKTGTERDDLLRNADDQITVSSQGFLVNHLKEQEKKKTVTLIDLERAISYEKNEWKNFVTEFKVTHWLMQLEPEPSEVH